LSSGSHHRSSERSGANLKDSIPDKDISPMLSQANVRISMLGVYENPGTDL